MTIQRAQDIGYSSITIKSARVAFREHWSPRVVALAVLVVLLIVPGSWIEYALCPFRFLFHTPCPLCGITRASSMLLHLDMTRSWDMHPLAGLVVVYLLAGVWCNRFGLLANRKLEGLLLGLLVVVVWGIRLVL